jgi:hypothetical protein
MKTIYMEQTIMLLANTNPKLANELVQKGVIKELNNMKYLVIEENLEK